MVLGVIEFVRVLSATHPELTDTVGWQQFMKMAQRSEVAVRILPLSRPARLLRYGDALCIQINVDLNRHLGAYWGMHELCHVWRDEIGMSCFYSVEGPDDPGEKFADNFAWYVTSDPAFYRRPLADRSIPAGAWSGRLKKLEEAGYSATELAIAISQPESRIREWRRGKSRPDPVTARILDRMLSAMKRAGAK